MTLTAGMLIKMLSKYPPDLPVAYDGELAQEGAYTAITHVDLHRDIPRGEGFTDLPEVSDWLVVW